MELPRFRGRLAAWDSSRVLQQFRGFVGRVYAPLELNG